MSDSSPTAAAFPELSLDELRRPGKTPSAPFQVRDGAGEIIVVSRLLRVLPGKRLVGDARWREHRVVAKLFVARHGHRHWQRERQGVALLQAAQLPTPTPLYAGAVADGAYALLTDYLPDAETLADRWASAEDLPAGDPRALAILRPAFALFGRLHAADLVQNDAHLGNFLAHKGRLWLIDGDGIARIDSDRPGAERSILNNLALLIAQLPPVWETCLDDLMAAYLSEQQRWRPDRTDLLHAVKHARDRRLAHFLGKTVRDCSQFVVHSTARLFSTVLRTELGGLTELLADPDAAIATGQMLKNGNTCTVARVDAGGQARVIKRYNLKNRLHALSRLWRPSRAWHAWLAGHRLAFYGIATPAPLAMLEERVGPLRRRAYLITEFCPGESLLNRLSPERPPDADVATAIVDLFQMLARLRISHGDTKATNFIWREGRLALIDLDAMHQHTSSSAFARHWRRDRRRFLRNWPESSVLHRWLDEHLPEAR